jgi:hypothetical protein
VTVLVWSEKELILPIASQSIKCSHNNSGACNSDNKLVDKFSDHQKVILGVWCI